MMKKKTTPIISSEFPWVKKTAKRAVKLMAAKTTDTSGLGTVFTPSLDSHARTIGMAHWAKALRKLTELMDESSLAACLVAVVNVSIMDTDGDGLMGRTDETLHTVSDDYCAVSAMSS